MANWTIKKAVENVPPEGTYLVRVESIEAGRSGENSKNPGSDLLKFKGKIVTGDESDKPTFYVRSLLPQALGMLGRDLAATGQFDIENDELPDDAEQLCQVLNDQMAGRVYMYEVKHRDWNNQTRADYSLIGPSTL